MRKRDLQTGTNTGRQTDRDAQTDMTEERRERKRGIGLEKCKSCRQADRGGEMVKPE